MRTLIYVIIGLIIGRLLGGNTMGSLMGSVDGLLLVIINKSDLIIQKLNVLMNKTKE